MLGLAAGVFTTGSIIPQIFRVFINRKADDVSLLFSVMLTVGTSLWLFYGIIDKLLPIIIWNVLGFTLNAVLLICKLRFDVINRKAKDRR